MMLFTRWSAALAGCICASALLSPPAVAGPTGAHASAPPSSSSSAPFFFPTIVHDEVRERIARPASAAGRDGADALANAPARWYAPVVPFGAMYGISRFGPGGPFGLNGCPNLAYAQSAYGQPMIGQLAYEQPLVDAGIPGDPFARTCFNAPAPASTLDSPALLAPAHNKDALYGPGYHPSADLYQ